MRDQFSDASKGSAKRYQTAKEDFQALSARLGILDVDITDLCYETMSSSKGEVINVSWMSNYYAFQLVLKPNGKCIVKEYNNLEHGGRKTGKMAFLEAKQLFIAKVSDQFPVRAREGTRNFLSGGQDRVQISGQKFEI